MADEEQKTSKFKNSTSFQPGNYFWKKRSKHGRDKIFATPQEMLEAAEEYFQSISENPWYKREAVKSGDSCGEIIEIPIERPATIQGLCTFWGTSKHYLEAFERNLRPEEDKTHADFLVVTKQIRTAIEAQQLEGASVGAFNANIIARLIGLTEHTDITTKGEQLKQGPPIIIKMPAGVSLEFPSNLEGE